jgi:AraC-like DNA-binding protein
VDLAGFMEQNFMYNLPLEKFAYLTGRSLTTFKKDFKSVFNDSPGRWLTAKRLELAHYQLSIQKRKPTDVYLDAGFENLSHFSFAFKKKYGYSPANGI